ncbi:hypothetical protein V501_10276 [Pseudogymnoascus sp. VKM F-4519 (FW-2642)]|nr:hypothetical protein V501_10276 [Pseudogymnoascus sp. VKM F-4519 (FW-2642)]
MNNRLPLQPQSRWSTFRRRWILSLAGTLYRWRTPISLPQLVEPITIVCISDTHTTQPKLQHGDLLLHAGDLSQNGSFNEIQAQLDWLNAQPHKHKVIIGGNHDLLLDPVFVDGFPERIFERPGSSRSDLRWGSIIYLQDNSVDLHFGNGRKLKIYGAPSTQQFGNWAFQYPPIRDVWTGVVPADIDILLTHGPPKWHLDANALGNEYLLKELLRTKLPLVVFGHIHAGYGYDVVAFDQVQVAYDDIVFGKKAIVPLIKMVFHLLIDKTYKKWIGSRPKVTRLVNAAVVGGRRNEETRPPIVASL